MSAIEKKSVKAGKFVSTEHVDAVIKNYKQERWIHNSRRIGKEDSLSVWYSVEELENFMEKIKNHGGEGVRIYFGAYDQDFTEKPMYAGRQTVVLVATRQKETATGEVNKDLYVTTEKGSTILAYNLGSLCPPFCPYDGGNEIGVTILDKGDEGLAIG